MAILHLRRERRAVDNALKSIESLPPADTKPGSRDNPVREYQISAALDSLKVEIARTSDSAILCLTAAQAYEQADKPQDLPSDASSDDENSQHNGGSSQHSDESSQHSDGGSPHNGPSSQLCAALNSDVVQRVAASRRATPEVLREALLALCRDGFRRVADLAQALNRKAITIQQNYVSRMVREGLLELRYPDAPNHPKQAYRAVQDAREEP